MLLSTSTAIIYNLIQKYTIVHYIARYNIIPAIPSCTHPANVFKGRTDDDNVKPLCWDNYLMKQRTLQLLHPFIIRVSDQREQLNIFKQQPPTAQQLFIYSIQHIPICGYHRYSTFSMVLPPQTHFLSCTLTNDCIILSNSDGHITFCSTGNLQSVQHLYIRPIIIFKGCIL